MKYAPFSQSRPILDQTLDMFWVHSAFWFEKELRTFLPSTLKKTEDIFYFYFLVLNSNKKFNYDLTFFISFLFLVFFLFRPFHTFFSHFVKYFTKIDSILRK